MVRENKEGVRCSPRRLIGHTLGIVTPIAANASVSSPGAASSVSIASRADAGATKARGSAYSY
jgi:hypothetical protein